MSPPTMPAPHLRSHEHYIASCVALAQERLSRFSSLAEITAQERRINLYPRLHSLEEPHQICVLEEDGRLAQRLDRARKAVVQGDILFEHAAAGEGTRLMLGPKYLLNIGRDFRVKDIAHLMSADTGAVITPEAVAARLECLPEELLPITLGSRHMLQLAFDLGKLALELGESPQEVRRRQRLLVTVSEDMAARIAKNFYQWHFYGFDPARVYFLVQRSFHGINLVSGKFFYDFTSPRRLHNHGHMAMQQTMDHQIFKLSQARVWEKVSQPREAVADWLAGFADKISYNIEDLDYLTQSLDLPALGLALELGDQDYRMVMEVVANNPAKPQKGGMLAWDRELERDVMIESFQLGDIANAEIHYLNRNFNHYPHPLMSWRQVGELGLPRPIAVKEGFLYFQPVQGDINFLVSTAFFRRRQMRPIRNLKNPSALPTAVNCMGAQDRQAGFKEFVRLCWEGHH